MGLEILGVDGEDLSLDIRFVYTERYCLSARSGGGMWKLTIALDDAFHKSLIDFISVPLIFNLPQKRLGQLRNTLGLVKVHKEVLLPGDQ